MNKTLNKFLHCLAGIIAGVIVLYGLAISTVHIVLARLNYGIEFYQQLASDALKHPVRIDHLRTTTRGINPVFVFEGVHVLDPQSKHSLIDVKRVHIGIDLLYSLIDWKVVPSVINIAGTQLSLDRDKNGKLDANDIKDVLNRVMLLQPSVQKQANFSKIALPKRINLQDVNLLWHDATGRILPLENLTVGLQVLGDALHLTATVELNQASATQLKIVANIKGSSLDLAALDANIYFDAQNLLVKQWLSDYTFQKWQIGNGKFSGKIWLQWRHGAMQSIQSQFLLDNLEVFSPLFISKNQPVLINKAEANVLWQYNSKGWVLTGDQVMLTIDGKQWPENQFQFKQIINGSVQPKNDQVLQLAIIPLENITDLLVRTKIKENWRTLLRGLQPQGVLSQVYVQRKQGIEASANNDFSFQANLIGISNKAWGKWPGLNNLTGSLSATADAGQIILNTTQADLTFPTIFAEPLDIDNLVGSIRWAHQEDGWEISTDSLQLSNPLVNLNAAFNLSVPAKGNPHLNALAGFNMQDAQGLMRYLPVGLMPNSAVSWLKQAFEHNGDLDGSFILRGDLKDFPFDDYAGQFIVDAQVKNIGLHYQKDWPVINNIAAELIFANTGMQITATTGVILDMQIKQATANIANLAKPDLLINGNVTGALQQGLNFLQVSPLKETVGKDLPAIQAKGDVDLGLALQIPLDEYDAPVTVQGDLNLKNNDLFLSEWRLSIDAVSGNLQFTEDGINAPELKGIFFKRPLALQINTIHPAPDTAVMKLTTGGMIAIPELESYLNIPLAQYAQGNLNYNVLLEIKKQKTQKISAFNITSNLVGVDLDLPAPLKKQAQQNVPLLINLMNAADNKQVNRLKLKYGDSLEAELAYKSLTDLAIKGQVNQLSWDDWYGWYVNNFQKTTASTLNTKAQKSIKNINLSFGKLNAFNQSFNNARIELLPLAQGWSLNVYSTPIQGSIVFPAKGGRELVTAQFQRLNLAAIKSHGKNTIKPTQLPALNFNAKEFSYAGVSYGDLILRLSPLRTGVSIDQLRVRLPVVTLSAAGEWTGNSNYQLSHLQGSITSDNWGALLKQWDITNSMQNGHGKATFDLYWPAAPYAAKMGLVNGKVSLGLERGNIVNLSSKTEAEIGLGRILNLFSLQSISRSLTLNFSDITQSGFGYDTLTGTFKLQQGAAETAGAVLEGPVAKVVLRGRIGIAQKDYDLLLKVTPYLTSSIPVIATVAGGPVVGAIAWAAEKIVSGPVNKITSTTYKVTGSWSAPSVVKWQPSVSDLLELR